MLLLNNNFLACLKSKYKDRLRHKDLLPQNALDRPPKTIKINDITLLSHGRCVRVTFIIFVTKLKQRASYLLFYRLLLYSLRNIGGGRGGAF